MHYGITITHQEAYHLLLHEGKNIEESIGQGEYHYYKLVINDELIQKVVITLYTIHGDPDMYLSAKNGDPVPTQEKFWL